MKNIFFLLSKATTACIITIMPLYGCQDFTIAPAQKHHLEQITELTTQAFFNDFKPIICAGYSNNIYVSTGHTDSILKKWMTIPLFLTWILQKKKTG